MRYLVVVGAGVDFLPFLPLCLPLVDLAGVVAAVPVSAAIGAADFGMSAAIAAVAIPRDNKAVAINLVMGSPAVGLTSARRIPRERDFEPR
jgi:hypothetical protein